MYRGWIHMVGSWFSINHVPRKQRRLFNEKQD